MKKYLLLVLFLLEISTTFANVNTKLVYISNVYNNPSANLGTLTFEVQAISDAGDVSINAFQNALDLDANFISRSPSVSFTDQLFPNTAYNWGQAYSSGKITIQYTFNSGTRSIISGSVWSTVVRIAIQYSMAGINGAISWSTGLPNYYVTNSINGVITGSETAIPSELQIIPLPVELTSFSASIAKNTVNLKWQTKTEVNNYGFEIERKVIGKSSQLNNWNNIGFVQGKGNSNSPSDYSFIDKNAVGGTKFLYRLKQIDNDGKYEYSDEVEVSLVPNQFNLYQNYPNPFNPETNIRFALPKSAKVNLIVYNLVGERVSTLIDEEMEAGYYDIPFNASNFSSGVYLYRLTAENFVQTKKMTLLR